MEQMMEQLLAYDLLKPHQDTLEQLAAMASNKTHWNGDDIHRVLLRLQ